MISLILPIYNVEEYIAKCLESVINQTFKDIEIICVNDFTMDNSMTIVKEYAKRDSRIKIINNQTNRGLGGARNAGLDIANGEFIIFVDTDDQLMPSMVEDLYTTLLKTNSDMVFCDVYLKGSNELKYSKPFHKLILSKLKTFYPQKDIINFKDIWPSAWNKIYRAEIIKKYKIRFLENILFEDHTFYWQYILLSKKIDYLPKPLYIYKYNRPTSITNTASNRVFEIFTILDEIENILKEHIDLDKQKNIMITLSVRLISERDSILHGKLKYRFSWYAYKYLLKFNKKDISKYKDTFINDKLFLGNFFSFLFPILMRNEMSKIIKISRHPICSLREYYHKLIYIYHIIQKNSQAIENIEKRLNYLVNNYHRDIRFSLELKTAFEGAEFIKKNMHKNGIPFPWRTRDQLLEYSISQITKNGLILEFGVFKGVSISLIANILNKNIIYGFDSCEGLPETWCLGFEKGTFSLQTLPSVPENVSLVKGMFDKTLPNFLKEHQESISFIHIGCDLYSSTKCVLSILSNRITRGTIIVFDKFYNYLGWENGEYKAFFEFINETKKSFSYIGYSQEQVAIIIE